MTRLHTIVRLSPLLGIMACAGGDGPKAEGAKPLVHPHLLLTEDRRAATLARLNDEPWATIWAKLGACAAAPLREPTPGDWDSGAHGANATVAECAATIAYLSDDEAEAEAAAQLSRAAMAVFDDNFEDNSDWDVNIRMPGPLIGYASAHDLLLAAGRLPEDEALALETKLIKVTTMFWDEYLEEDVMRQITLGVSQNNHPIRTASAVGVIALAFPDAPDAEEWLNWSVSELSYLWGPTGQYVQSDGGVSEGPFYYGFGLSAAMAFFIAAHNSLDADAVFESDCRNRQDIDPWIGHGCVEGAPFTFQNPLFDPQFHAAVDWSITLRLPSGLRAPKEDGYFNPLNGGALLTGFGGAAYTRWDWENVTERPMEMSHGQNLIPHHLIYVSEEAPTEPPFLTRLMPVAGEAVFRSGWDADARFVSFIAESGSARKTLHDHVDSSSFSLAAYGEYLLVDPGYYKPNELDNAVTSEPYAHNVLLIDGRGAPEKGLLTNFGDTDASFEQLHDGERVELAEAMMRFEDTDQRRALIAVDGRYFLVLDRLDPDSTNPREHRWRVGGWASDEVGGAFTQHDDGATWERSLAGVRVTLASTAPGLTPTTPEFVSFEAPYVHEFNLSRDVAHHSVLDGVVNAVAPGFLAVLAPYRVGAGLGEEDGPLPVTIVAQGEGWALIEVQLADETHWALSRDPDAPESFTLPDGGAITTDAAFALWSEDGGLALILHGQSLTLDGVTLAEGDDAVIVVE
jgi:hypothetical protein